MAASALDTTKGVLIRAMSLRSRPPGCPRGETATGCCAEERARIQATSGSQGEIAARTGGVDATTRHVVLRPSRGFIGREAAGRHVRAELSNLEWVTRSASRAAGRARGEATARCDGRWIPAARWRRWQHDESSALAMQRATRPIISNPPTLRVTLRRRLFSPLAWSVQCTVKTSIEMTAG